jgi:hypothetical protein
VTTPKLPTPPRSAQDNSGCWSRLPVRMRPSAPTTSTSPRLSTVQPKRRVRYPSRPPGSGRPGRSRTRSRAWWPARGPGWPGRPRRAATRADVDERRRNRSSWTAGPCCRTRSTSAPWPSTSSSACSPPSTADRADPRGNRRMEGSLPRWPERPRPPAHGPGPGADPRRAHRPHTGAARHPAPATLLQIKQHALSPDAARRCPDDPPGLSVALPMGSRTLVR